MGYTMTISHVDGQDVVEAIDDKKGERFVAPGGGLYEAACRVTAVVGNEIGRLVTLRGIIFPGAERRLHGGDRAKCLRIPPEAPVAPLGRRRQGASGRFLQYLPS